jgi:DNA-binding NtrC family response regulator
MPEKPKTILVVDDEAAQRRLLGEFIRTLGFKPIEADSAEEALESVRQRRPAMVLLDVRLPGMSGLDALAEIRKLAGDLPILLITAYADLRQAVEAMKTGADDYLSKPVDLDELATAITDALGTADGGRETPHKSLPELPPGFICESAAMRHVVETCAFIAPSDAPVLITGPSGAGKEVIARLIHHWSGRTGKTLVAANCAGLPETLIESELFGHTRGAFTGATSDRPGFFRTAHQGTLFLDEIGELPLHLQPKLLRALESGQVTPVGSDLPVEIDTRLLAATNRDLAAAVRDGQFREDLYYRVNVVELAVPPLSQRREDIPKLARQFATEYAGGPVRLSPQTMHCLVANNWSGNVRELRNALQRACLLCRGDIILPEHLPPKIAGLVSRDHRLDSEAGRLSQVERATILATLEECQDNRTQAAKKLGISRRALIYKLRAIEEEME